MERVDLKILSVLIWSWQNKNLDFIEFAPEENSKINEGVKLNKESIDLGDRTVNISTQIVFEKKTLKSLQKLNLFQGNMKFPHF